MAKRKLQVGLIGCGMIAQAHARCIEADRRAELRWGADIDPKALKRTAKEHRLPHTTDDYRDVLKDDEVDIVIVCTPPSSHPKIAIEAMRAGKHALVEKPLAAQVAPARRLVAEARKHPKLKVSACSARHARFNPKFAMVKKMIDRGDLGEVYFVHHRSGHRQGRGGLEYNPNAKWFLDRSIAGGGPMYDWGVYDLSFHLGVLGQPELAKVEAFCRNGLDQVDPGTETFTVEEHGGAFMVFKSGMRYYWERATNAHNDTPNQTAIFGTKGGLKFGYCTWDAPEITYFDIARGGKGKARQKTIKVNMKSHPGDIEALVKAYIDYVLGKGPVPMSLETELENIKIMHRVYKAAGWV